MEGRGTADRLTSYRGRVLSLPARPVLLELDLTAPPVEQGADEPLARFLTRGRHLLRPTLRALHEAAADPHVRGLIAKVGGGLPWAVMQELRLGVRAFAAGGKPTLAWAETFGEEPGSMAGYVLATAFDQVWLQPGGDLGLLGVGVETTFVRGALDRLGIEPQLQQRHEYKNAADRFMRSEFTEAHRAALDRVVESVFAGAVEMISEGRGLDVAVVRELVDGGPHRATAAKEAHLVDVLGYRDDAHRAISEQVGDDVELRFADRWRPRRQVRLPVPRAGHVALVDIRGVIATGRSRRGPGGRTAGSDTVGAALRAALADSRARAVVVRVESPGGSAAASETIWREVSRLREAKPVIVSMGGVAASGGYYVACAADVIVALPATLTGSIGVVGGKVVVGGLLERLGLTTGTVSRGEHALMYSGRRGFDEPERERLAAALDAVYDDFVAKVAQGRGRPREEIDAVARGRVWTGSDAQGVGLVDELGGLRDAVRIARARAGLPEDAPVRPAVHVPPLARLRRPVNSDDPRAAAGGTYSGLGDVAAALGLSASPVLRMPFLRVR